MKRKARKILLAAQILILLLVIVYFTLAFYYQEGFSLNTWVNGVYCTGKTLEEVNEELLSDTEALVITVTNGTAAERVELTECGVRMDYYAPLQHFLQEQNSYLWVENLFGSQNRKLSPQIKIDEERLREKWDSLSFVKEEETRPKEVRLFWTEEGYQLEDTTRNRLDVERAFALFEQSVREGNTHLDLTANDLYTDLPYTQEQEALLELWKKIKIFQDCRITYDMGDEQIVLGAVELGGFLKQGDQGIPFCDANGQLAVDLTRVDAFLTEMLGAYNTYGKERVFASTRGDLVTVPAGKYGTELDLRAEAEYLSDILLRFAGSGRTSVRDIRTPVYLRTAYHRGLNDIGDTYIEIDMTEQKLYYYSDGECVIDTDVVTGNTGRRMGTPEGVYYVYAKQRNRVLRGPGYASYVKYWMPVYKGVGIHDANWRKEFGGEIYKKSGSHGCINTPTEKMTKLYELAEIGTPVVIFY